MNFATSPVKSNAEFETKISGVLLHLLEERGSVRQLLRMAKLLDVKAFDELTSIIIKNLEVIGHETKVQRALIMILNQRDRHQLIHHYLTPVRPRR